MKFDLEVFIDALEKGIVSKLAAVSDFTEMLVAMRLIAEDNVLFEVDRALDPGVDRLGQLVDVGDIDLTKTTFKEYLKMYSGTCSGVQQCGKCRCVYYDTYYDWLLEKTIGYLIHIQPDVISKEIKKLDVSDQYAVIQEHLCFLPKCSFDYCMSHFGEYLNEACEMITFSYSGTGLNCEPEELFDLMPVFQENPLLSEIVDRCLSKINSALGRMYENLESKKSVHSKSRCSHVHFSRDSLFDFDEETAFCFNSHFADSVKSDLPNLLEFLDKDSINSAEVTLEMQVLFQCLCFYLFYFFDSSDHSKESVIKLLNCFDIDDERDCTLDILFYNFGKLHPSHIAAKRYRVFKSLSPETQLKTKEECLCYLDRIYPDSELTEKDFYKFVSSVMNDQLYYFLKHKRENIAL